MITFYKRYEKIISQWMADHSLLFLRIVLGIIFFWFGFLKFFSSLSSAEDLAWRTIEQITFNYFSKETSMIILAVWECLIGIGLIIRKFIYTTLILLFLQMIGTLTPLFIFPAETFSQVPFVPTLKGQYIIKNFVIIASAMVIGGTARGGEIISEPRIAKKAKEQEEKEIEKLKK